MNACTTHDAARERQIAEASALLQSATNREDRRASWERMRTLLLARSPVQVMLMERERGLR
ncbi:MAG: hypothetical protein IT356_00045 [Gemmatimonadaceae bacterium]|nr:hypothetical protein [Gemmatimonadaceae bacterium]